jgi:uncharacterized membrane protein
MLVPARRGQSISTSLEEPPMRLMSSCIRLSFLTAGLATFGCGGGDGGNGPSQSIQVSASPPSLTVQQGQSGTVTVTLVRGGGFSGDVSVTITGLPDDVDVSVNPSPLTGTTTSAIVTVAVAVNVPPGTYTATVRASATGVGETTATYTLVVTATPNYALSASPNAISVGQGASGTSTINIDRTNFTGTVTLSLDNPPAGITGSFNPQPAGGTTSELTVSVPASAPLGNQTITVKGTGSPGDRTTTITVTVTPPPNFTLSVDPNPVVMNAGSNQTATVNIVRENFTGPVALLLDNPPMGISAAFNPPAPNGGSSIMNITVAGTVQAGDYNLTVKGTSSAVPIEEGSAVAEAAMADRFTTFTLTVMPAPDFSLSLNPSSGTTTPGGSLNTTGTIARTNFGNTITFDLQNPPGGITGMFNPTSTGGTTFALTLNVPASTAPGTYMVTVRGTAGTVVRTATMQVTVQTGPPPGQVQWDFPGTAPLWFGFKDGAAGWVQVQPTMVGMVTRFTFTMNSATGAVAYSLAAGAAARDRAMRTSRARGVAAGMLETMLAGSPPGSPGTGRGVFALDDAVASTLQFNDTREALQAFGVNSGATPPNEGSVGGSVTGVPAGDKVNLGIGGRTVEVLMDGPWNTTTSVGSHDMVILRSPASVMLGVDPFFGTIIRGQTVPGTRDLSSFATHPALLRGTVANGNAPAGAFHSISEGFFANNEEVGIFPLQTPQTTNSARNSWGFGSGTLPTDLIFFHGSAFSSSAGVTDNRSRTEYRAPNQPNGTIALPNGVAAFTVTVTGPAGNIQCSVTVAAPGANETSVTAQFIGSATAGAGSSYSITASSAWMAANGNTLAMDDKSSVGFPVFAALNGPLAGSSVSRTASNIIGTRQAGSFLTTSTRLQFFTP